MNPVLSLRLFALVTIACAVSAAAPAYSQDADDEVLARAETFLAAGQSEEIWREKSGGTWGWLDCYS